MTPTEDNKKALEYLAISKLLMSFAITLYLVSGLSLLAKSAITSLACLLLGIILFITSCLYDWKFVHQVLFKKK